MPFYSLQNNQKPRQYKGVLSGGDTTNTLTTIANVVGTGNILSISITAGTSGNTVSPLVRVTIDGTAFDLNTSIAGLGSTFSLTSQFGLSTTYAECNLSFKQSFKVEVRSWSYPTYATSGSVAYELE